MRKILDLLVEVLGSEDGGVLDGLDKNVVVRSDEVELMIESRERVRK